MKKMRVAAGIVLMILGLGIAAGSFVCSYHVHSHRGSFNWSTRGMGPGMMGGSHFNRSFPYPSGRGAQGNLPPTPKNNPNSNPNPNPNSNSSSNSSSSSSSSSTPGQNQSSVPNQNSNQAQSSNGGNKV